MLLEAETRSRNSSLTRCCINNKMAKKKSNLKIVAVGKPNIGFLPLSIGEKVLRRMAVMQETEKLKEGVPTKVNKEGGNQ